MGTPAFTLFASWPAVTKRLWVTQALALIQQRRNECPASRATTYYFQQDNAGDDTGGGGAGTEADPYLVDTFDSFVTMYTTLVSTGNVSFLMKKDSVLVATNGGGLTMSADNVTLGAWGSGVNDPIVTGFIPDDGTGWTSTGTGAYYKTYTVAYWVRYHNNLSALFSGTETVFTKRSSQATVEANDNSWWWDSGTNRLYVRVGANLDPGTDASVEVCQTNNKGIYVSQADGCRISNWISLGWGMGTVASQQYNIHVDVRGTDSCYVYQCKAYYSGHHVVGHLTSGGGAGGGLTLWEECEFGLGRADSSGTGTMFVAYSNDGAHEWILYNSRCRYGVLPDVGRTGWSASFPKAGTPYYGHADTTNETAFALVWNFRTDTHTYGCRFPGNIGNPTRWDSASTNRGVLENYRAWIIGETFIKGSGTQPVLTRKHVAVAWSTIGTQLPTGTTALMDSGGSAARPYTAQIGLNLEVDYTDIASSASNQPWGANLPVGGDTAADVKQYVDLAHCTFRLTNTPTNNRFTWDARSVSSPWTSNYNRVFNCIWSCNEGANAQPATGICPNAVPSGVSSAADASLTGGGIGNAFYRTGTSAPATVYGPANFSADFVGHSNHTGYVTLSAEPDGTSVPSQCLGLAQTSGLPFTIEWWQDSNNVLRAWPASPSIGAVQADGSPPLFAGGGTAGLTTKLLLLGAA